MAPAPGNDVSRNHALSIPAPRGRYSTSEAFREAVSRNPAFRRNRRPGRTPLQSDLRTASPPMTGEPVAPIPRPAHGRRGIAHGGPLTWACE